MPHVIRLGLFLYISVCIAALPCVALAQRTDDNATAESDDAFGRSVGSESVGIYDLGEVRGFSPIDAGNVRIEGLYFDRQTSPSPMLVEGSAIRVGIAAQSYPFPSPTGIVDYDLRRAGNRTLLSPVVKYGPLGGGSIEIDSHLPLLSHKLAIEAGAGLYEDHYAWGGSTHWNTFSMSPQWTPTDAIELRPFYSAMRFTGEEPQSILLAEDGLPNRLRRNHYFGQRWEQNEYSSFTYGTLGRAHFGQWNVRLGVFESIYAPEAEYADLYQSTETHGPLNEQVVAFQNSRFGSTSGELRIARTLDEGNRRHTFYFTARGRFQERRYGGEDVIDAGATDADNPHRIAKPQLNFGAQSHDEVRQRTAGLGYELRWKQRGELSFGVQKTAYAKSVDTAERRLPESTANPTLLNATATLYAGERVALYGSFTEGLEESPVAPSTALNRNAAAPALMTNQYDAGVRWTPLSQLKVIAGLFAVKKPYFDLDAANVFTSLGTVQHRGIELSISGSPIHSVTVVAGSRYLDATVSGPAVDAGLIGRRPVASSKPYSVASVDYALGGTGFSIDTSVESLSPSVANAANTLEVPTRTTMNLGGRYRFRLAGKPATLRMLISNLFDNYGLAVVSSGAYVYTNPFAWSLYLATDL